MAFLQDHLQGDDPAQLQVPRLVDAAHAALAKHFEDLVAGNLRQVGNSEQEFLNSTFQEDLSYKNQLIKIFGKPYEGTIGPGKIYPAGYDGPTPAGSGLDLHEQ